MSFLLAGCGGSTSDSGFPEQQAITPTTGVLEGRVQLPDQVNDANLNSSIQKIGFSSSVRRAVGQITNYSGFGVVAQYISSSGSPIIFTGSINSDGTYFIEGLPFGKEIEVTISQGKLVLKATVPPLQSSIPQLVKNVDVSSTAETLLYNQIKNNQPSATIETIDQFQSFESEKTFLAELISNELKNENVDADSKPLLERTLVTENLVRAAEYVEGTSSSDNHLPYAIIDKIQQNQRGKVEVGYRLFDAELDLANIILMYSTDGINFSTATIGSGGSGVTNLATLRTEGVEHNLFWESAADLGVGIQQNIILALDIYPFNVGFTEEFKTRALTVNFSVDNRGLPEVLALSSANHQLGTSSIINIQGNNLSVVSKIYLEYFGNENFIQPRSREISGSEFQIINDQQIEMFMPAYGLFPVDYRIVLQGDLVTDNSISTQSIAVQEIFSPNFSNIQVGLSPVSIQNDLGEQISFQGFNLMGSFEDRAKIRLNSNPAIEYVLSPISAVPVNNVGLVRWTGSAPTMIQTGLYSIFIRNSCNPTTPCGDEVLVTENGPNSVNLSVIESASIIDDVRLEFGVAVNNTNSRVSVIGQRLSSVQEARISTDRDLLVNSFASGFPLTITSTAYDLAELVFPLGGAPGNFYVAVMNQGGITVSNVTFTIQEGVVPTNSISVQAETTGGLAIINNITDNITDFQIRITGTSLSSLETVRLINQDIASVVVNLIPVQTTFTEALVTVPKYNPPGRYSLDLINSAGLASTNCGSSFCLEITEDLPLVTTFQNLIRPQDLQAGQMIAGENAVLEILGQNLSGVISGKLCDTPITCPYNFTSVSGEFFKAIANITSSNYMKPGTYFLEVTNQSGSTQTTTDNRLEIFERQPVVDSVLPRTLTNKDLIDQTNTITFNGRNIYGINEICLLPQDTQSTTCSLSCTDGATYRFVGTEVNGLGRNQATLTLANNTQIIPGEYVWIVKNFAPVGTDNFSVCSPLLHSISITEPTLEFISFAGTPTPNSTSVLGHTTSQIKVIGDFLYGVDKVQIKRRFDVFNIESTFDLQIDTTTLSSVDLIAPAFLIPGTYDLYMKNSGMSVPIQQAASVVVSEVLTPVISEIRLRGSNQENTNVIFFDIYGDQIAGAALITKDIKLMDIRDNANIIPIPVNSLNLSAEADQTPYITIGIPTGTPGGDYKVLLTNSALRTTIETQSPIITIFEPLAQFQSVSVVGPFNQDFGFGENNRNTRLEFRGLNLGSSDRIRLVRELEFTGDSQDTVLLSTAEISRRFGSTELTLTSTLETFLRPGFYDVEIRNNSGEFSNLIDPVSSPFFEQVQVLEGAPQLDFVGCLDFSGVQASCSLSATEFNIDSLKNFEFTGQNIFTLNRVDFLRAGDSVAEYTFNLPLFGKSLAGTGVITHTSRSVALDMPDVLRYIGFYDIELTNAVSTVRFREKLHSVELFEALITSLSPNQAINNTNTNVLVSGDHLRGVTYAALWDTSLTSEIATFDFVQSEQDPKHFLTLKINENISPGNYKIIINNTKGFVSNPGNDFTITEPSPSVEMITESFVTNAETQVVQVHGDGFLGLTNVVLKPSTTGQAGTSNSNMSITHSQIPVHYSVTSRSLMSVSIPPFQLPGFYQLSLENTNPVSYLHTQPLEIRERQPSIQTLTPNEAFYAQSTDLTVQGSDFLGIRGTVSSDTYARLIHVDTDTTRDLDLVSEPSFNSLTLVIPENLLIGAYKLELKNTQGVIDSLTTTEFEIQEGLVELSSVTTQVLQYDADFTQAENKISLIGKHLQGVKKVELVTTTLGKEYRYMVDHQLATLTPYVSMENMPINTDMVYPGKYLLEITNEAGLVQPTTPVIDVQIGESSITNFTPKIGPYNAPTEITISGTNLRRFDQLIFERNVPAGSNPDDSINILEISTNGDPDIFSEISNTEARVRFISQESDDKFDDSLNRFFKIKWKTYGDLATNSVDLGGNPTDSRFQLNGFFPEISAFEDEFGTTLQTTTDFVDPTSIGAVSTTAVFSGLPLDLVVKGEHFGDIRAVKLVNYNNNSIAWTLACTTGTGGSALNAGNSLQLTVNIPRELFQFPANGGGNTCTNDSGLLPLKPDLYLVVLEDEDKISSKVNKSALIYFGEGPPDNLIIENSDPNPPRYNNANDTIDVTGINLSGTKAINLFLNGVLQTTYSTQSINIVSDTKVQFSIEAGTLRGIREEIVDKYSLELINSRTSESLNDALIIREDELVVTSILPSSGKNNTSHPIIINGTNLLGVGQTRGATVNQLRLIHEQSYYDSNIATVSYDLTNSTTVQSLTSFVAVIPPRILPGRYFLSVENDHRETAVNPKLVTNRLFESLDSVPVVTFVTPLISDFDLLPTTMVFTGAGLIGVRTATLTLMSEVTSNIVTLSLLGSPELTGINDHSVHFLLPESPDFIIPGTYNISLTNSAGDFNLPNFELLIREKFPQIDSINPLSKPDFDNSSITTFTISGDNLFGLPNVSVSYQSTTLSINISGVIQSRNALTGLTLASSLFPDTWTLSVNNSRGSTSKTIIVTEPIPEVKSFDPAQVPFNDRTKVSITGDHFLGVLTSPGSVILTDELGTPLEDIELIDRYNISAWVPEGINIGKYEVLVTNKRGQNTTSAILTVLGSGLSLDSISPNTGLVSGGEFIILEGSGFVEGTRVAIDNIMAQDVRVTPNRIEAFVPSLGTSINQTSVSTSVTVQVFNPDGESIIKTNFFTYIKDEETDPKIVDVFPGVISGTLPGDIPVDTKIAFIFDQAIDPQTVLTAIPNTLDFNAIEVLSDSNLIGGTVTWSPDKTRFVYSSLNIPFLSDQLVEVGFANLITGENGRILVTTDIVQTDSSFFGIGADQYIEDWSFTAGNSLDTGNLSISSPIGTGGMAPSTWTTTVIFNKPINPLTLFAEDFILTEVANNHRVPVEVRLLSAGTHVDVNPTELLRANQNYKLIVKNTNLMSLTDLSMSSDYTYQLASDPTGPNLVSLNPQNGRTGVARNSVVIAKFDQPILVESVNTSNLYIESTSGIRLDGTFSNTDDNLFFTFDFFDLLNAGETYIITVSNRIKSITGVPITSASTSSFEVSTNNEVDLAGPVVLDIFPANLQSGVSTAAMIVVTFSEPINLADVSIENFSLRQIESESTSVIVSYQVQANAEQDTVILDPLMPLIHSANYEVIVTSGVRDLSNNNSINSVSVTFTVTPQSDLIGPGIDNITPINGASDVQIDTQITILFNEPINAIDATDSSKIHIKTLNGEEVMASYNQEQSGKLIRIIPQESLFRLTQYIVTIGQDVRDLFGNPRTQTTTFSFTTEDFVDSTAPEITLLTINGIPAVLNGGGGPILDNSGNNVTPVIHVPTNGFTIDLYYFDPGSGGESSGVDQNTISIVDEKVIFDSNQNQSITNLNLLQQGVTPIHGDGYTRIIVPSTWSFSGGLHILKAQVKDQSSAGNLSPEFSYSFQVTPMSSEPLNYPFESGNATFSLDYESDYYLYDSSVQLGNLRLRTLFESDGSMDFNQELMLIGLISDDALYEVGNPRLNLGSEPFPSAIAVNVVTLLQNMILGEVRKLFDLDASSGEPNDPSLGARVRFENQISPSNQSVSRIAIGGDNGAEINGGLGVIKSMERSIYNTANRDPYLSLIDRSASVDEGYGVFSAQVIRNYANNPNGFNEWNARFGAVSYFAYTNTAGQSGQPIGFFPEDANVYNVDPSQVDTISNEFHRFRYSQMRLALESYAKIVAVSVARVAAKAVGLMPQGFPPSGLYGGSQNLPEYFNPSGSNGNFLDLVNENNLLRQEIDLNSIFQDNPGPLSLSNFAKIYLRNSIRVTQ